MDERRAALQKVKELGFSLNDVGLYLDTHPSCANGLEYYKKVQKQFAEAVADYTRRFGPLTAATGEYDKSWTWINEPWPWEMEA